MQETARSDESLAMDGCDGTCQCAVAAPVSVAAALGLAVDRPDHRLDSLEAIVAIAGGVQASSIALVGFGLDSVIEVSSALVIAWRLTRRSADQAEDEQRERRAVRLIAGRSSPSPST